jgi:hypothetical protein
VDGKWVKLYDPKQEGKRSPLHEVYEGLMMTGVDTDKELARSYRSRKFYIVKVIDRDHEQDGVKFWRFKHNHKGDGVIDKIFPVFRNKGDVTSPENGRDLILSLALTKAGTGKEYTVINSVLNDDPSALHSDADVAKTWLENDLTWSDVYSKKGEDYLEMVAKGEVPRWDSNSSKWVSNSTSEEVISSPKSSTPTVDPQAEDEADEELPF